MLLLLAILSCWALGFAALRLVAGGVAGPGFGVARAVIAWNVGVVLVSLLHFVARVLAGELSPSGILGGEAALLAVLWLVGRRSEQPRWAMPAADSPQWLTALLLVALALAAVAFVLRTNLDPHGLADALASTNHRARLMLGSGEAWRNALSPAAGTHPGYPLLLSCFHARTWSCHGTATPLVPALVALGFTAGCVAVLWAASRALVGSAVALAAVGTLLVCPAFFSLGAYQMADIPAAFGFLAALACAVLHQRFDDGSRRLLVAAGFAAAASAWAKNEGLLFVLVFAGVHAAGLRRGLSTTGKDLVAILLGAMPGLLVLVLMKQQLEHRNEMLVGVVNHLWTRTASLDRHLQILAAVGTQVLALGPAMVGALAIGLVLAMRRRLPASGLVVVLMAAGYYGVYLTATADLKWHLESSLSRVLLQLLPSALLVVVLRPPPR